ncbi:MAG: hypothetical protein NDJ90_01565 [Oligoflexia bacterium]|nr:hypothetical protein [Oligoflexia bacterium]
MTTFQSFIYALLHGFTEFLPVSAAAHDSALSTFVGWPTPEGSLAGALSLGALLAVLVFFRHDWASMISCFLQVLIFRKRPMTLDERMPIFLFITSLPTAVAWYYLHERLAQFPLTAFHVAGLLAGFGLLLGFTDSLSRKNKGMFDWNWRDALFIGLFQTGALVPGCGQMTGALLGAMLRNYRREAAAKYAFFASAPVLAAASIFHLRGPNVQAASSISDLSWLSFSVALVVTLLAGLLAIGGFMGQMQRRSPSQYVVYRWLLAATLAGVFWFRAHY